MPLIAAGVAALLLLGHDSDGPLAHKETHTAEQLKAFEDVFMEQVQASATSCSTATPATEKKMGTKLSRTGMACAMCHPYRLGHPPARVPEVPGADERVRDAARHDQLVHREAQRGREARRQQRRR